jgi:EAL domain-containing protein (putative c-di-GMP-specific phosphodiesterase class I)
MSAVQLETPEACNRLIDRVRSLGIDPARITIEITESVHIDNVQLAVELLSSLRDVGVGISIDDFGSGHSSVSQVLTLPATEVKIDRSLIDRPIDEARELIRTVVDLARQESLRVVAEGVETAEQLELVRSEGCDRVQGFLLGRPKPRPALEKVLAIAASM